MTRRSGTYPAHGLKLPTWPLPVLRSRQPAHRHQMSGRDIDVNLSQAAPSPDVTTFLMSACYPLPVPFTGKFPSFPSSSSLLDDPFDIV